MVGHAPVGTSYTEHRTACEALIVNTHGNGVCLTTAGPCRFRSPSSRRPTAPAR